MMNGQTLIVLTLGSLFLMTVIFMSPLLQRAQRAGMTSVFRLRSSVFLFLPQVVDDDVHEPRTERAVLLAVRRLLAVHVASFGVPNTR